VLISKNGKPSFVFDFTFTQKIQNLASLCRPLEISQRAACMWVVLCYIIYRGIYPAIWLHRITLSPSLFLFLCSDSVWSPFFSYVFVSHWLRLGTPMSHWVTPGPIRGVKGYTASVPGSVLGAEEGPNCVKMKNALKHTNKWFKRKEKVTFYGHRKIWWINHLFFIKMVIWEIFPG